MRNDGSGGFLLLLIIIAIIYTANMSGHIAENTLNVATLAKQISETPQEWDYQVIQSTAHLMISIRS